MTHSKIGSALVAALAVLALAQTSILADVINFDELTLAPQSYMDGYSSGATGASWTSNGVEFNTGAFTGGWSYSNVNDTATAGYTNQWAAYTGVDFSGSGNYAVANSYTPNSAYFNLSTARDLDSVRVTNSTYAALSMIHGDAFAKSFGGVSGDDPDFFRVIFHGHTGTNGTGTKIASVDFYLADYRFADNSLDYIVDSWEEVDLSSITGARSVSIELESSDVGASGLNTPAYVAIDQLQLVPVPEPNGLALIGLIGLAIRFRRRRTG